MGEGRGRPAFWLNEYEFVLKYRLLIERPPRCVCGGWDYRFGLCDNNTVNAKCNICRAWLRYSPTNQVWRFIHPFDPHEIIKGY
jgi:hypothetical protein